MNKYGFNIVKYAFLLIASLVFSAGCWATEAEDIFSLMHQRLSYMKDVALYKLDAKQPLLDETREKVVLEKAMMRAREEGLSSVSIEGFVAAQMNAAKAIQYRYMAEWMSRPPLTSPEKDLKTEIRPAILNLGTQITKKVADYLKSGKEFSDALFPVFERTLNVENLTTEDKKLLFGMLKEIRLKKNN
ncbi:chorismate mutase AroQ, gamma subclass [Endozoicomonas sp. OPT23]|uniref:gamma subclass chorismate mutase AroQ n=1 Tax=Endozoicomonas sp. OPT23 TaxID=2072845 RepID=UPI00129C107E|nr:gamma subclass chorismate mutase AroQ [Endozoicomonas sp. OPT23]MRI31758.1 chorismate mutase AroQ, gamma subclass [Endozoicomonas sp. OPT23]